MYRGVIKVPSGQIYWLVALWHFGVRWQVVFHVASDQHTRGPGTEEKAAREATAIVERAEATVWCCVRNHRTGSFKAQAAHVNARAACAAAAPSAVLLECPLFRRQPAPLRARPGGRSPRQARLRRWSH
jgi:hypothetical protein